MGPSQQHADAVPPPTAARIRKGSPKGEGVTPRGQPRTRLLSRDSTGSTALPGPTRILPGLQLPGGYGAELTLYLQRCLPVPGPGPAALDHPGVRPPAARSEQGTGGEGVPPVRTSRPRAQIAGSWGEGRDRRRWGRQRPARGRTHRHTRAPPPRPTPASAPSAKTRRPRHGRRLAPPLLPSYHGASCSDCD